MKSIMEEASSLAKAIEQGWQRAGKPAEFTIKVLQEPEKNFLGFTKKPARIAFFVPFSPTYSKKEGGESSNNSHSRFSTSRSNSSFGHENKPNRFKRSYNRENSHSSTSSNNTPVWTDEIISFAQSWLSECLTYMSLKGILIRNDMNDGILELTLSFPFAHSEEQQQILCRSLAHLTVEALRNKFKQNLRALRISISPRDTN